MADGACARPAQLGILQVHLSGGEPTARRDLEEIVKMAARSRPLHQPHHRGVLLKRDRLEKLAEAGLDHVQLSIQDVERRENADRIGGYKGGMRQEEGGRRLGA